MPAHLGRRELLAVQTSRDVSDSSAKRRSVRSAAAKQWQPPEGLAPDEILAIIDAASTERDRLLLRVLWATAPASARRWPSDRWMRGATALFCRT